MRKTAVYVFVILSILCLGLTFIPSGHSQTQTQNQNVKVIGFGYYFDNQGILDAVGQVQNIGNNTVNPVVLTGEVYSPEGTPVSSSYTQAWVSYLTPGQKAPFYMEFYPPQNSNGWLPDYIGNITLAVVQANVTDSYQYQDLKITSSTASIGTESTGGQSEGGGYNGAYMVNGDIQNIGTQAATNITVVGTFFNSTGNVVGVGYTNYLTPMVLNPNETATFQICALDLNQSIVPDSLKITSYSLLVQTQEPLLNGTAPPSTSYQSTSSLPSTSSPTSSPSSSSQAGVTPNDSSDNTTLYVIVIAVVIIAVAAAGGILVLKRSKSPQTIKESRKARKQNYH